jgi:hypothetical protein
MPRAASPRAALVALAFGAAARAEMVAMNIAVGAGWLAFEFDTLDGREAFEARAIRFAAENGLNMGEGCHAPKTDELGYECVGRRMARKIIEERGHERVVAPAMASVAGYAEKASDPPSAEEAATCRREVLTLAESGAWRDVDLGPFDDLNDRVTAATASADQVRLGHTGRTSAARQWYVAAARLPCVRRICEVGFNEGHSASLWLLANPEAEVVMFDLYEQPSAPLGEAFLRDAFGDRLYVVRGPSEVTVPHFSFSHPATKCDLLVVDGSHEENVVSADIANLRHLARSAFHLLLLDDTAACRAEYCAGPNAALADHERRGTVVAPIFAVSQDPSYLDGFLSGMTATAYARPWA